MNRALPVNEEGLDAVLASIDSVAVRNLVQMAVASARMKFMCVAEQSHEDWQSKLPLTPFDMGFFAKAVAEAFKNESAVRAVLDGATIAEATGWDV